MSSYLPPFLSEFPDATVVADCVPASGVMLANKATHGAYPASVQEREALQVAMGTQDVGANAAQLAAGIVKRYGLKVGVGWQWSNIQTALSDSRFGVALFGTYQALPPDVRGHSRQPTFQGGHCMYAQGDGAGTVELADPLASAYLPGVPVAELQQFCAGLSYQHLAMLEVPSLVGFRAYVGPGAVTFWQVLRFTHTLYAPRRTTWARQSWAPVNHGSPGFWRVSAGAYTGSYLVNGRSGPFTIRALYSDGSSRPVPAAS